MKNLRLLLSVAVLTSWSLFSSGQDMYKLSHSPASSRMQPASNYFKVNVTGLFLKNAGFQYERVLNQHISVALGARYMPSSGIPFKSTISNQVANDNQDVEKLVKETEISNYAITPEVKIYVGKGYGQGAYVSFFYRYLNFDVRKMPLHFNSDVNGSNEMKLNGNLKSHTGGFLLGWQKTFGEIFTMDVWFIGPHIGKGEGSFTGKFSRPLTSFEQQDIDESLNDLKIPVIKKTVTVNEAGATYAVNGLWGGIRSGISLGVRF